MTYEWSEIVFKDKKDLKEKDYFFIAGFREISDKRFTQLLKQYLAQGNILVGILKNKYIEGYDGQEQFQSMPEERIKNILEKITKAKLPKSVDSIEYFQKDLPHIIEKLKFKKAIFINGSWHKMFHLREEFYSLIKTKAVYELVSPFVDENEAVEYAKEISKSISYDAKKKHSDNEIFEILNKEAARSFATDFQTSCAIVKGGKILMNTHNEVVPYETYAWHFGSIKEKNFSPANDLNHFDTIHAEMVALLNVISKRLNIDNCSLYINLMPCPACAKAIAKSNIKEIVYQHDHSDGYAIELLTKSGKSIRRFVKK